MPGPDIETESKFKTSVELDLDEPIEMLDDDVATELVQKWREVMDKELQKMMGVKQQHARRRPELKQVIDKHT